MYVRSGDVVGDVVVVVIVNGVEVVVSTSTANIEIKSTNWLRICLPKF